MPPTIEIDVRENIFQHRENEQQQQNHTVEDIVFPCGVAATFSHRFKCELHTKPNEKKRNIGWCWLKPVLHDTSNESKTSEKCTQQRETTATTATAQSLQHTASE